MSDYQIAVEGMSQVLSWIPSSVEAFNRRNYKPNFEGIYQKLVPSFDAIEQLYCSVLEPEAMLENMADAFTQSAVARIESCKNRRAKDAEMMNLNLHLAVFVYPAILNYKGTSSLPLTDKIGQKWKEAFPKSNVSRADLETIEKGFQRKFCYITTAVCETFQKPDDCYELTLLRNYRDGYMMSLPEGEELIRRYYDLAPTIVKHIDQKPDRLDIYRQIWDRYLSECIRLIEENELERCRQLYTDMVGQLQAEYFFVS